MFLQIKSENQMLLNEKHEREAVLLTDTFLGKKTCENVFFNQSILTDRKRKKVKPVRSLRLAA